MKVLKKYYEYYDNPVPVYDVTNLSGNENFVLSNGVVVHNCMEATKDKVNANEEIASIFAGLGLDPSQKNPVDKLRFGKIIILADADVDGKHINCLLLTLFWKYLPGLIKQGRLFIVKSPLFRATHKGKLYMGKSKQEIYDKAGTQKMDISRLKGWGECSEDDLRIIAMDPKTRTLLRVLPPKDREAGKNFEAMMGKDASYRRELLGIN